MRNLIAHAYDGLSQARFYDEVPGGLDALDQLATDLARTLGAPLAAALDQKKQALWRRRIPLDRPPVRRQLRGFVEILKRGNRVRQRHRLDSSGPPSLEDRIGQSPEHDARERQPTRALQPGGSASDPGRIGGAADYLTFFFGPSPGAAFWRLVFSTSIFTFLPSSSISRMTNSTRRLVW